MSQDTFTKMCSCPEIQGRWVPKVGNWVWVPEVSKHGVVIHYIKLHRWVTVIGDSWRRMCRQEKIIYFPTQEDLQGMLEHYWDLLFRNEHVHLKLWDCGRGTKFVGATAKEALIQGVMHGHSKKWDAEKGWVEE